MSNRTFEAVIYVDPFTTDEGEDLLPAKVLGNIDLVGARGFVHKDEVARLRGTPAETVFGGYRGIWEASPKNGFVCLEPYNPEAS